MKKISIILILFYTFLFAQKTDVYFGNGILTIEIDAIKNTKLLKKEICNNLFSGNEAEMKKQINKISYAYNQTEGMIRDLLESSHQKNF